MNNQILVSFTDSNALKKVCSEVLYVSYPVYLHTLEYIFRNVKFLIQESSSFV